ncbi:hypothetical protein E2C01_072554 [Portunus trituberculatus]|uniref:Uncharacterized protein n=1 Tax=Portunus trituberculatus TaxID=210409 RepID=A0A5B7I856_PORTR|nr:hypothetical protein [Portunus trituberculatus]
MIFATLRPKDLGRLGQETYTCNIDRQGSKSGTRWVRNQHRSIEVWHLRSSGHKPASTSRLGDVRNAPVAKRTPA